MTDILISAAYVFLVVNLLASSGTESLSSLFKWRARMLADNVKIILNEKKTGLATKLYSSPLVHPRGEGEGEAAAFGDNLPSYIEPVNFANALLSALSLDQAALDPLKQKNLDDIKAWVPLQIQDLRQDARLSMLLADSIHRNGADLDAIRTAIAAWYNMTSQRISGAFKRRTQLSSFLIALVMAVVFDLSPLPPSLATTLQSASNGANGAASVISPIPKLPQAPAPVPSPGNNNQTASTPAPPNGALPAHEGGGRAAAWAAVARVMGWFSIAFSTLLGAPFWFGLLSKVTNVRGSGDVADGKGDAAAPPQVTATARPGGTVTASTEAPSTGPTETGGGGTQPGS